MANASRGRPDLLKGGNVMHRTNHGDADLLHQMHEALRVQNPQWVGPDGESPICDDYERRFARLLELMAKDEDTSVY